MTGPDYPRPSPTQSAIGEFVIGESAIGIYPATFDVWQTVLSQYANSPTLTQLIVNFASYVDQATNLNNFFDLVWNVDTAMGYGLDVWGRIVGVNRVQQVDTDDEFLGFQEMGAPDAQPFNQAPFYAGFVPTQNFPLSDEAFRVLIFAKALANISDGSIPAINQLLRNLFPGRGNCYVRDDGGMVMTYVFEFALSPVELTIVQNSGALPKPVGVQANVEVL